jgi:PKD repeat protein
MSFHVLVSPRRRVAARALAALLALLAVSPGTVGAAQADTSPPNSATPLTVASDVLPTVQVDGVVWAQTIVGDTVYATGEFAKARPAGAAPGTDETPRSNILAYNLRTGELITTWAPSLNAQGLAIAASTDGSKIIVAGDFTKVSGINRYRIVELDAATGEVIATFTPGLNARARALTVAGDTVYVGGIFTTAASQARTRLAAISVSTGTLLDWAPAADAEVMALTAPPGTDKVIAGGRFTKLNSTTAYGLGALNATTGATLSWGATATIKNSGTATGITSLHSDATQVYGTGYTYGTGGNLENSFAAASDTGTITWINGCKGDTYDAAPVGGVLYTVSHAHDCGMIGGHPQTVPWTYQRAMASTTGPAADGRVNTYGKFPGWKAPELLHWHPTLAVGTYTGQTQAAWTISATAEYVVLGGEFPKINGVAQQGLARFAITSTAPNREGPQGYSDLNLTVAGVSAGTIRASFKTAWDRDNRRLTYELLRGDKYSTAEVVATRTIDSNWWTRPLVSLLDSSAPAGTTASYRLRVKDPFGNFFVSPTVTGTVPTGTAAQLGSYAKTVLADGATEYWRLGETSGATGYSLASPDDLTLASVTRQAPGAISGDSDTATTFPGSDTVPGTTKIAQYGAQVFTEEAWFKTTTTRGGKIIGFGNNSTEGSTNFDRHVYMTNAGKLVFGVNGSAVSTAISPASYNNGAWHHVAATLSPAGITLYVDGKPVASNTSAVSAQEITGYWRVGGDNLGGWPSRPTSTAFAGSIDEVAIYPMALTPDQIKRHHAVGTGAVDSQPPTTVANQPPTAAFVAGHSALTVTVDGTASADPDGTIASYTWDFGDGGAGTGATANHTYTTAGTYEVKLTVTDDKGATASVTHPVSVTPSALASDTFSRTVTDGFGTSDSAGTWTVTGAGADSSVSDGSGRLSIPAARSATARLGGVSSSDTSVVTTLWLEQAPTGGGVYPAVIARGTGTGDYRGRLRLLADGSVLIGTSKVAGGTETLLVPQSTVPGLAYTAGTKLDLRVEATGTAPTTIRARVWVHGTTEPTTWQTSATDSTSGLQEAGAVGVVAYVSGSATATPVVVRVDDLTATAP